MSTNVEERVVKMTFDNAQFEKGAKETMSTLERLKASLSFKGVSEGFKEIQNAANKTDLSGMSVAVEGLKDKFSVLDVVGFTVIQNLTNAAMNAAKKMLHYFATPLTTGGWNRALNIDNAKFQLAGLGIAYEKVEKQIDFAVSGTAYSLDAAAKAASQLSASGVKAAKTFDPDNPDSLGTALRSISGVAAMTNSSYEEIADIYTTVASNGKLMTQQLRQMASRGLNASSTLAQALGVTESDIAEMVRKSEIDFETFSNAMYDAFGEHAVNANNTYSGSLANLRSAFSRIGAEFAGPIQRNAIKVFNAIRPIVNALKNELVPVFKWFGARADAFGDMFSNIFGDKKSEANALSDLIDNNEEFKNTLIEVGKAHGVLTDSMIKNAGSLEATFSKGWLTEEIYSEAISEYEKSAKSANKTTKSIAEQLKELQSVADQVKRGVYDNGAARVKRLTEAGYDYATVQGIVNHDLLGWAYNTKNLSKALEESAGLTKEQSEALKKISEDAKTAGMSMEDYIASLYRPTGKELVIGTIQNSLKVLYRIMRSVRDAWNDVFDGNFSESLYRGINAIYNFSEKLRNSVFETIALKNTFRGLFSVIDIGRMIIVDLVNGALTILRAALGKTDISIVGFTGSIGEWLYNLRNAMKENDVFAKGINAVAKAISKGVTAVRNFVSRNKGLVNILKSLGKILVTVAGGVINFVSSILEMEAVQKVFSSLANVATKAIETINGKLESVAEFVRKLLGTLKQLRNGEASFKDLGKSFGEALNGVDINGEEFKGKIDNYKKSIQTSLMDFGSAFKIAVNPVTDMIMDAWEKIRKTLSRVDFKPLIATVLSFGTMYLINTMIKNVTALTKIFMPVQALISSLSGVFSNLGKQIKRMTVPLMIVAIAFAILELVVALKMLQGIKFKDVLGGLLAISIMLAEVIGIAYLLNKIPAGKGGVGTVQLSGILLGIGATAIAMAFLLKIIASLTPQQLDNAKNVAVALLVTAGVLALAFAGMAAVLPNKGVVQKIKVKTTSLAVAIAGMAVALWVISKIDYSNIEANLGTLVKVMLMLGVAVIAITKSSREFQHVGATVFSIASSLLILYFAMKLFSEIPVMDVVKGAGAMLALFIALLPVLMFQNKMGGIKRTEKQQSIAGTIMAMAAAMVALSIACKIISTIDDDALFKSAATIGGLILVMGVMLKLSHTANPRAFTNILAMTAFMAIATASIVTLSYLSGPDIAKGVVGLGAAFIGLQKVFTALSKTKIDGHTALTIGLLAGVLAGIVAAFYFLSNIETMKLLTIAGTLTLVMVGLSAALFVIGNIKLDIKSAITTMAMMVVMLGSCALVLGVLTTQIGDKTGAALAISEALTKVMVSLGFAMLAAAASVAIIGASAVAIGAAVGTMAVLGGLLWAAAEFGDTKLMSALETAGEVMHLIGVAFGNFLGGFGEGATNSLPKISANINAFAVGMTMFTNLIKNLDASILDKVKTLHDIVKNVYEIGKYDLTDVDYAGMLDVAGSLGEIVIKFQNGLPKDDEAKDITKYTNIITAISQLASILADVVVSGLSIDSFTEFIDQCGRVIEGISEIGKTLTDENITEESVTKLKDVAEIIKAFADISKSIPNSDPSGDFISVAAKLFGDNRLDDFSEQISRACTVTRDVARDIGTLDAEGIKQIDKVKDILIKWVDLANSIPNMDTSAFGQGGAMMSLATLFVGNNDVDEFALAIKKACETMNDIIQTASAYQINDTQTEKLYGIVDIMEAFTNIANAIPTNTTGSFKSLFSGTSGDLTNFGENIKNFMHQISLSVDDMTTDKAYRVITGANSINRLIEVCSGVANVNVVDLKELGVAIQSVAIGVGAFGNVAEGAPSAIKSTLDNVASSLNNSSMRDAGTIAATTFTEGFESVDVSVAGGELMKNAVQGATDNLSGFTSVGMDAGRGFVEGVRSYLTSASYAGSALGKAAYEAAKKALDEHSPSKKMHEVGNFGGLGFVNGLEENIRLVAKTSMALGAIALESIQNAMGGPNGIDSIRITPVLDLDQLNSDVANMDNLMNSRTSALATINSNFDFNASNLADKVDSLISAINQTNNRLDNMNVEGMYELMQEYYPEFGRPITMNGKAISKQLAPNMTDDIADVNRFQNLLVGVK